MVKKRCTWWVRHGIVLLGLSLPSLGCQTATTTLWEEVPLARAQVLARRLTTAGIDAQLGPVQQGRCSVQVSQGQEATALALLQGPQLPGPPAACLRASAPLPLLPSRREQHQHAHDALACDLAKDGLLVPGVLDLRVQLVQPQPAPLGRQPGGPVQAVAIVVTDQRFKAQALREWLLATIPNLVPEHLTLIAHPGPPAPSPRHRPIRTPNHTPMELGLAALFTLHALTVGLILLLWHQIRHGQPYDRAPNGTSSLLRVFLPTRRTLERSSPTRESGTRS